MLFKKEENLEVFKKIPTVFNRYKLNGADFSAAHLEGAYFINASLLEAQFLDAFLEETNFYKAEFRRRASNYEPFLGASWDDKTHFGETVYEGMNLEELTGNKIGERRPSGEANKDT